MRLRAAVLCGFVAVFPLTAVAQSQRTFVSADGLDTNPCSRSAPCRNFAAAVAQTLDGGEVVVLDSAGYGPVTVTTSVSLIAPPGVYAGITAFSGDAIAINAPSSTVTLRGLTLNGEGGTNGVDGAAGTLHIENCSISRFSGHAVSITGGVQVYLHDVTARENGGDGIAIFPATGTLTGVIDHCRAESNQYGIVISGNASATPSFAVLDSIAVENQFSGIGLGIGELHIKRCLASGNRWGVYLSGTGTVSAAQTTATGNSAYGFLNTGGTFDSFGNNRLTGNAVNAAGVTTIVQR